MTSGTHRGGGGRRCLRDQGWEEADSRDWFAHPTLHDMLPSNTAVFAFVTTVKYLLPCGRSGIVEKSNTVQYSTVQCSIIQ